MSQSGTVVTDGIASYLLISIPHPVTVLLKDSYGNLVSGEATSLKFLVSGHSSPEVSDFQEVKTGTYTSTYQAFYAGQLKISAFFKEIILPGFPYEVFIHSSTN